MKKILKRGEFLIVIEGNHAKAYDRRSRKKLFDGSPEQVFKEVQEKIEGAFNLDLNFNFPKKKRRRDPWGF